jgi:hypothetical protein
MGAFTVVDVRSPEGTELLAELRREGGLSLLAGSAISSWEPFGLPTGQAINEALADVLATDTVSPRDVVRRMIAGTAFEHVMECAPDEERLRDFFADAFHPVIPNPVHRAIVELTVRGVIRNVVTTNYDTGLEAAADAAMAELHPMVARSEGGMGSGPVLLKLHGCASRPATLVFSLSHERLMDGWKREALGRSLRGRTLLVMGYSGLDFEICPELPQMGAARVVWGHFDPAYDGFHPDALRSLTANARRVLEETRGTVLYGDLRDVLTALGARPIVATWSVKEAEFVRRMSRAYSSPELDRWRMRLYNGIGCALDARGMAARVLAEATDEGTRLEAEIEHARALFHMGRYRTAVAEYGRAAEKAGRWNGGARLPGALHGLAESARVGGSFCIAHAALERFHQHADTAADADTRRALRAEVAFLRVLLLRNYYQVSQKLHLIPLTTWLRRRAVRLLRIAVPHAVTTGDWPALQQGELWARRLQIGFDELYAGPRLPLPSSEGYRQLGYLLAAMMAIRDRLARGEIGPADVPNAEDLLRTAEAIGNDPEVWKFAEAFRRAGGVLPEDVLRLAAAARDRCEDGPVRRLAYLLGFR